VGHAERLRPLNGRLLGFVSRLLVTKRTDMTVHSSEADTAL
jgi:hypothetical protein